MICTLTAQHPMSTHKTYDSSAYVLLVLHGLQARSTRYID